MFLIWRIFNRKGSGFKMDFYVHICRILLFNCCCCRPFFLFVLPFSLPLPLFFAISSSSSVVANSPTSFPERRNSSVYKNSKFKFIFSICHTKMFLLPVLPPTAIVEEFVILDGSGQHANSGKSIGQRLDTSFGHIK